MRKLWRWLIGASNDSCLDRETPAPRPVWDSLNRADEGEKWPTPAFDPLKHPPFYIGAKPPLRADIDVHGSAARKPKAPKRPANARPPAKSKPHKTRL
jgi:hypothetical protein